MKKGTFVPAARIDTLKRVDPKDPTHNDGGSLTVKYATLRTCALISKHV